MVITSTPRTAGPFFGDDVATVFPYGFRILGADDLEVRLSQTGVPTAVLVRGVDYEVTGADAGAGGDVVLTAPLATGQRLDIIGAASYEQPLALENQGQFFARDVMRALDRLAVQAQQLKEAIDRAVVIPPEDDVTNIDLLIASLTSLDAIKADLQALAAIIPDIQTTSGIAADVTTVSSIGANITTVAGIAAEIAVVVANIAAIQGALGNAQATAADRVQTGLDAQATAADRLQTGLDAAAAAQEADDAAFYAGQVQGNIIPVGAIAFFADDTPPSGWLVCDGSAVTALYPELRAYLVTAGQPFGNNGTDPLLPDLRGEFIRGWDGGRGIDAGRVFGSAQAGALEAHTHSTGEALLAGGGTAGFAGGGTKSQVAVSGSTGGAETRPRNVALLPCIKAFGQVDVTGAADLAELLAAIATQAEAEAGTNNTKLMTPLRSRQADEAFRNANALGWGQTWQDVTASRASNTTYQNTSGKPIQVSVLYSLTSNRYFQVSSDGVTWLDCTRSSGQAYASAHVVIPPGGYYRSAGAFTTWLELR